MSGDKIRCHMIKLLLWKISLLKLGASIKFSTVLCLWWFSIALKMYPASKYVFLTLLIIIISKIKSNECAISRNSSSIHPRANDAYQSSSSSIDRQFPGDVYGNFSK